MHKKEQMHIHVREHNGAYHNFLRYDLPKYIFQGWIVIFIKDAGTEVIALLERDQNDPPSLPKDSWKHCDEVTTKARQALAESSAQGKGE